MTNTPSGAVPVMREWTMTDLWDGLHSTMAAEHNAAVRLCIARGEQVKAQDAEWRARIKALADALNAFVIYGCPACHGDCGSANPPVMCCPMQDAAAALRAAGLEA